MIKSAINKAKLNFFGLFSSTNSGPIDSSDVLLDKLSSIENRLKRLEGIEKRITRLHQIENANASALIEVLEKKLPQLPPRYLDSTPEKFESIKNKYLGERCFILGTGPSLLELDLSLLEQEYVFSVNGGINLLGKDLKKLCGYCIADPAAYNDFKDKVDVKSVEHFFINSTAMLKDKCHLESAYVFDTYESPKLHEYGIQLDLTKPLYSSHTVLHPALQIAVYMGFETIYIAGVDLDFKGSDPHFYKSNSRELEAAKERSSKYQNKMYLGFKKANRQLSQRGIKLYNLSPVGSLDCIERVEYNSVFSNDALN